MVPASAESPPCSACSIPARLTSPLSTLTTASAPPASPPASIASNFVFRNARTPLNLLCSLCVLLQFFLLRFQQNLQDSGAFRKRHRFLRFLQSKPARNEWLQIHAPECNNATAFFERPAPRANDVDLSHHNRPRLHGRCAMKCGLQHQRPARFDHLLRQRQSAWRTGSLHNQRKSFLHARKIAAIAADLSRLDSGSASDFQLIAVLAIQNHPWHHAFKHPGTQLPELSIPEHRGSRNVLHIDLL